MKEYIIYSDAPETTEKLGYILGKQLEKGDIVLLDGSLGAGKTCLTRGLASALEISEPTVSPTYTLVNEYHSGILPLYHYDVYRLSGGDELFELGFEEQLGEGVIVVEWAVNVNDYLSEDCIKVFIERLDDEGPEKRKIHITIDKERGDLIVNSLG